VTIPAVSHAARTRGIKGGFAAGREAAGKKAAMTPRA